MAGRYDLGLFLILSALSHVALLGGMEAAGDVFWTPITPSGGSVKVEYRTAEPTQDPQPAETSRDNTGRNDASVGHFERSAVSLDTPDPLYRPYLQRIKRKIRNHWGDPGILPREPRTGSLLVEFILARSGELTDLQLRESSKVRGLDQAALEAVKGAAPYEPFPSPVRRNELRIRALFVYE